MRPEIQRNDVPLPVCGEPAAANTLDASKLWIPPRTDAVDFTPGWRKRAVCRTWHAPAHPLEPCAVGHERFAVRIELMAPAIDQSAIENLDVLVTRIETEHSARFQAHHAVWRLGVGSRINRLVHIKPAVRAPAQGVKIVMRVLSPESAEHDATGIRLPVTVSIFEVKQ